MHASLARALRHLPLLALLAAPASAGVITVAADGSGDFTSINTAVLAAADGDTLVVRPGSYGPFTMGGSKSLSVVSDGSDTVTVNGPIGVLNGAAGRTWVLAGLSSQGLVGSSGLVQGYGFWASGCAGDIRVQDCSFTGAVGDPEGWDVNSGFLFEVTGHAAGWHGVWLKNNAGSIALNDCFIRGGNATYMASYPDPDCGYTYGEPGGQGLYVENSVISLADCDVEGGYGATADRTGGAGGSGLQLVSGSALVSAGTFEGGDGGGAFDYIGTVYGGPGGAGILVAPGATAWLLGELALGGEGGPSLTGNTGADGVPVGGAAGQLPGHARSLTATAPAYVGGLLGLQLTGQPGDVAMLFVSTTTGLLPSVKFGSALLVGPAFSVALGVLPPGGQLLLQSPTPAIAPLLELPMFVQGLAGVPGDASFTGTVTLVLVDPAGL